MIAWILKPKIFTPAISVCMRSMMHRIKDIDKKVGTLLEIFVMNLHQT